MARSYVYFIKAFGRPPRMKIGKSNDPHERLKELQTACPYPLKIMASIPCRDELHAFQVERLAHEYFAKDHKQGEWFKCTDFLVTKAFEFEVSASLVQSKS